MAKQPEGGEPPLQFSDREKLEAWLNTQKREVAVAIAARAALWIAPVAVSALAPRSGKKQTPHVLNLISAILRADRIAAGCSQISNPRQ